MMVSMTAISSPPGLVSGGGLPGHKPRPATWTMPGSASWLTIGVTIFSHEESARTGPMSNSLRDQLIKAGLATEEHLKRARASDRRQHRQANQQKRAGGQKPQSEAARLAAEAAAREKAKAQALNRERQAEKERLAAEAQARDLVVKSEISRPPSDKDIAFN